MSADLLARLNDPEDNFVERKPEGASPREIRRTMVAFANSVPEGRAAYLFFGVSNDGRIAGVQNPDALQKKVRTICEQECYPAIPMTAEVVRTQAGQVVAILIPHSTNRPHFAGPAYVRRGSESVAASTEQFDALVWSRNSKCAKIQAMGVLPITVIAIEHRLGQTKRVTDSHFREGAECRVESCDAHTVTLRIPGRAITVTEPLEHVTISYNDERHRPMLVVTGY